VTIPVRLAKELGISTLIVTNAAGGIRGGMTPGEIMFIEDHINFLGENPLIGQKNVPDDKRFPDMTNIYDERIIKLGLDICDAKNIKATRGIYLATKGPSFETPAEIRAFKTLGADAVGMSTVPEVIVARQEGLTICGISCISNLAAGISKNPLSHEEVGETIQKIQTSFADMLTDLIKQL
jgi:purine-nucleoside phosphorylase